MTAAEARALAKNSTMSARETTEYKIIQGLIKAAAKAGELNLYVAADSVPEPIAHALKAEGYKLSFAPASCIIEW